MGNSQRNPNGSYLKGRRYAALSLTRPYLLNIVPFVVVGSCENVTGWGGTPVSHFVDSISFPCWINLIDANYEYKCLNLYKNQKSQYFSYILSMHFCQKIWMLSCLSVMSVKNCQFYSSFRCKTLTILCLTSEMHFWLLALAKGINASVLQ